MQAQEKGTTARKAAAAQDSLETLLPKGLSILIGSTKISKSWLILSWGLKVASGRPILNFAPVQGVVLALCPRESIRRIQNRLNRFQAPVPPDFHLQEDECIDPDEIGLRIRLFRQMEPRLRLVLISVNPGSRVKHGRTDPDSLTRLRETALELGISVLVMYHPRPSRDRNPLQSLPLGQDYADLLSRRILLDWNGQPDSRPRLICTGGNLPHRELLLDVTENGLGWDPQGWVPGSQEVLLPPELEALVRMIRVRETFLDTNTALAETLSRYAGRELSPKGLKQQMNRFRTHLEACGIRFRDRRSNGRRLVEIVLAQDPEEE